jgi:hypothetical protein
VAALAENARFANLLHGVCLQMSDILEIDMDYVPPVIEAEPEMPDIPSDDNFNNEEIWEELRNSMGKIFNYAELMRDESDEFIALMGRFRSSKDKLSTEESMRKLRKSIAERFYKLYYTIFTKAVMDDVIPIYVQMFLNFGYLDETLAGEANSIYLYKLVHRIDDLCINDNVYTIFHWLKLILWGEKEPSHNTFDQSYEEYIRNGIRTGNLTISEDSALSDNERKVRFEIANRGNEISIENVKNIWDEFYRTEHSEESRTEGTGLGLAITKNILELHNAKYGYKRINGENIFWFEMKSQN